MKKLKSIVVLSLLAFQMLAQTRVQFPSYDSDDSLNIFLLRGLTRESGHWGNDFAQNITKKFPNSTIHYLDLPGAGVYNRDKSPMKVNSIMEFMRSRAIEKFKDTTQKNIIVATSLGGMVAMEWVLKHKSDFDAAVLVVPSFKKVRKFNERVKPSIRKEVISIGFTRNMQKREAKLVKINSNRLEKFNDILTSWVNIQKKRPMAKKNIIRQSIAGMRYQPKGKPNIPILVIGSYGDRLVKSSCTVKVATKYNSTLEMHNTSGHALPIDAPEWLVDTIKSWIDVNEGTIAINTLK